MCHCWPRRVYITLPYWEGPTRELPPFHRVPVPQHHLPITAAGAYASCGEGLAIRAVSHAEDVGPTRPQERPETRMIPEGRVEAVACLERIPSIFGFDC